MRALALLLGGLVLAGASRAATPATNLTVDAVLTRFIERSRSASNRLAHTRLVYLRRTTTEQFDPQGKLTERKSKEQRVELRGQEQQVRLVQLNGRAPSPAEAARETEEEGGHRKRYTARSGRGRRGNVDYLDEKLIRRFSYTFDGLEDVAGRPTFRLRFEPGPTPESQELADRVLGLLHGRIWIDAEDFELVNVEAQLSREFSFWGGVVGSLDRLDFALRRQRLPDGTWVNLLLASEASGRKVFSRFSGRMRVEQEDFQPLLAPAGP
jgi:hypothetical protein